MPNCQSDYLDLIYQTIVNTQRTGIGNCVQAANRASHLLNTGTNLTEPYLQRLPRISRKQFFYHFEDGEALLKALMHTLNKGQHVQISAYIAYLIGIIHVFNAIKLEGKIKLIDNYQTWPNPPWLQQAWHHPKEFLKLFENFSTSPTQLSYFKWQKIKESPEKLKNKITFNAII